MKCNKHFTNVCDTWVEFMPSSCLNLSFKFYVCPLLSEGTRVYLISFSVLDLRSAGESSTRRLRAAEPPLTWPKSCDLCVNRPIMRGWREDGEARGSPQWPMRGGINSSCPIRIEDGYTPFPGLCRPGEGISAMTHSSSRYARVKTYHILWKFLKSEIRETGLSVEKTIPEKRSYSAWNIESQILTPKREVTHIFHQNQFYS